MEEGSVKQRIDSRPVRRQRFRRVLGAAIALTVAAEVSEAPAVNASQRDSRSVESAAERFGRIHAAASLNRFEGDPPTTNEERDKRLTADTRVEPGHPAELRLAELGVTARFAARAVGEGLDVEMSWPTLRTTV